MSGSDAGKKESPSALCFSQGKRSDVFWSGLESLVGLQSKVAMENLSVVIEVLIVGFHEDQKSTHGAFFAM